jgi:hypothetical protein
MRAYTDAREHALLNDATGGPIQPLVLAKQRLYRAAGLVLALVDCRFLKYEKIKAGNAAGVSLGDTHFWLRTRTPTQLLGKMHTHATC